MATQILVSSTELVLEYPIRQTSDFDATTHANLDSRLLHQAEEHNLECAAVLLPHPEADVPPGGRVDLARRHHGVVHLGIRGQHPLPRLDLASRLGAVPAAGAGRRLCGRMAMLLRVLDRVPGPRSRTGVNQ